MTTFSRSARIYACAPSLSVYRCISLMMSKNRWTW